MYPIDSREALARAPEVRVPGAEWVAAHPERHAAGLLAGLPAGVGAAAVSRVVYRNFANDPCVALLLRGDDGADYLLLNEIGPDAHGEMARAGRGLALVWRVPYTEGPPSPGGRGRSGWLIRLLGYAA